MHSCSSLRPPPLGVLGDINATLDMILFGNAAILIKLAADLIDIVGSTEHLECGDLSKRSRKT